MSKGKKQQQETAAQPVADVVDPAAAEIAQAEAEAAQKAEQERIAQEQAERDRIAAEAAKAEAEAKAKEATRRAAEQSAVDTMNALALRIWDGQSSSLPLIDRVTRIKAGLIHHGYEPYLASLSLPADGFEKYL